ncbi:MAG TPA: DUF1697 domain-containing protein [Solirubrobacteraceae bacterium]|nr:DUF1697 domain-containing protein [Solirubrobacteraceae bacterium]
MQQVIMLRGINLGPSRRVPMAELRALFGEAGYTDVRTYVQSGNVVLESDAKPSDLEREAAALISERFGFEVPVVVRTRRELAAVVKLNPLGDVADNPKRYQVSFLTAKPAADVVQTLQAAAVGDERVVAHGREIYAWHPDGVARSKLWNSLAGKGLGPGVTATARNWTTVTALLEMAGG